MRENKGKKRRWKREDKRKKKQQRGARITEKGSVER